MMRPLTPMEYVSRSMHLLQCWLLSRDWWLFLQGLPAVAIGIASLMTLGAAQMAWPDRMEWYRFQARAAFESEKYPLSLVCSERVYFSSHNQYESIFMTALASERLGQLGRAKQLLLSIAPLEGTGYGPAHLEVAKRLLIEPERDPETFRQAETHLLKALQPPPRPDQPEALLLLGEVQMATGRLEEAFVSLSKVEGLPVSRLRLAQLCAIQGRRKDAETLVKEMIATHQENIKTDPFSMEDRILLSQGLTFMERFPEAVAILTEAPGVGLKSMRSRLALSEVYIAWVDILAAGKEPKIPERLAVLRQALQREPADGRLLTRFWALAEEAKDNRISEIFREHLANGNDLALTNFLLGMAAWNQGKQTEARLYLERAYQASPAAALVSNNLAWMLVYGKPPQPERALQIIDEVIRQFPKEMRFRGTRGHVLAKMGKWNEALPELVASMQVFAEDPGQHDIVAEAYKQNGIRDMADEHRKKAEAIRQKAKLTGKEIRKNAAKGGS